MGCATSTDASAPPHLQPAPTAAPPTTLQHGAESPTVVFLRRYTAAFDGADPELEEVGGDDARSRCVECDAPTTATAATVATHVYQNTEGRTPTVARVPTFRETRSEASDAASADSATLLNVPSSHTNRGSSVHPPMSSPPPSGFSPMIDPSLGVAPTTTATSSPRPLVIEVSVAAVERWLPKTVPFADRFAVDDAATATTTTTVPRLPRSRRCSNCTATLRNDVSGSSDVYFAPAREQPSFDVPDSQDAHPANQHPAALNNGTAITNDNNKNNDGALPLPHCPLDPAVAELTRENIAAHMSLLGLNNRRRRSSAFVGASAA